MKKAKKFIPSSPQKKGKAREHKNRRLRGRSQRVATTPTPHKEGKDQPEPKPEKMKTALKSPLKKTFHQQAKEQLEALLREGSNHSPLRMRKDQTYIDSYASGVPLSGHLAHEYLNTTIVKRKSYAGGIGGQGFSTNRPKRKQASSGMHIYNLTQISSLDLNQRGTQSQMGYAGSELESLRGGNASVMSLRLPKLNRRLAYGGMPGGVGANPKNLQTINEFYNTKITKINKRGYNPFRRKKSKSVLSSKISRHSELVAEWKMWERKGRRQRVEEGVFKDGSDIQRKEVSRSTHCC